MNNMKWTEIKGSSWYCDTPIGRLSLEESVMGWEVYFIDKWIKDGKTLEEAKNEADVYLKTLYYKLKMYLEI